MSLTIARNDRQPEEIRLLLVANRTCPCPALPDQVIEHVGDRRVEVRVLAPALNSRLAAWVSDIDSAVRAAEERMRATIEELRSHGLKVTGEVGDANPLAAIADALHWFSADEIMISTWPAGSSHWIEKDLPRRAAERSGVPIKHLISAYDQPSVGLAA
jgi:hypothetical protein